MQHSSLRGNPSVNHWRQLRCALATVLLLHVVAVIGIFAFGMTRGGANKDSQSVSPAFSKEQRATRAEKPSGRISTFTIPNNESPQRASLAPSSATLEPVAQREKPLSGKSHSASERLPKNRPQDYALQIIGGSAAPDRNSRKR